MVIFLNFSVYFLLYFFFSEFNYTPGCYCYFLLFPDFFRSAYYTYVRIQPMMIAFFMDSNYGE